MVDVLYFTCLWGKTPRAWISIKPYRDGVEIGVVKWRGQPVTVKILSGTPCDITTVRETYPPDLYALLKSNLQKQVRRARIRAVATAAGMWGLGQFELLRRLVVITAEDVEVSAETAVIVWLMVAKSKGMVLNSDHRAWVLGYVAALVNFPVCRRLEITKDYNSALTPAEVLDSSHFQNEQIAAILFRTAYGGLRSDPPMISRCLDWMIKSKSRFPLFTVERWDQPLPKLLINRAAVDHHIWPSMVKELQDLHPEYSQDFIRTVIWECSSGKNKRKKITPRDAWAECWSVIQPDFKELTLYYVKNIWGNM